MPVWKKRKEKKILVKHGGVARISKRLEDHRKFRDARTKTLPR